MGHRLSKIYTRTGDRGDTGLGDGSRAPKESPRIAAIGDIDELNSSLGVLLAETLPPHLNGILVDVQHDLFDLGGEVCIPGSCSISESQIARLEAALDALNEQLPPLKEFVLPGGTRPAALAHLSRTICRRAERSLVALGRSETVNAPGCIYLNRLSDLLFVIARSLNRSDGGKGDVLWQPGKNR